MLDERDRALALARMLWDFNRLGQRVETVDCVVGLGSYDLRVAHRCADLHLEGVAPLLLFTGQAGNWTRGLWPSSEAEVFAEVAAERGVPRQAILLETRATNLGENIRFAKSSFLERAFPVAGRVLLVTKPQTERRAMATVAVEWPQAGASVTSPLVDTLLNPGPGRTTEDMIHELVGDTQRLKLYAERGFQTAQEIPEAVWEAYLELVRMGYDHHTIAEKGEGRGHDRA